MSSGDQPDLEVHSPQDGNYPLPTETRFDRELQPQDLDLLQQQWNIFNLLKKAVIYENPLKRRILEGKPELVQGTLVQGHVYNQSTLEKIKQTGILSGELVGIPEDMETNFCADFFKVPQDFTVEEYLKWCDEPRVIGSIRSRKPEGNRLPTPSKRSKQVALIVDITDSRLQPLLRMDAYDPDSKEIMGSVVTQLPREPETAEGKRLAAIMVGIPSNFINGVIIGNGITTEETQEIRDIMGEDILIYKPNGGTV